MCRLSDGIGARWGRGGAHGRGAAGRGGDPRKGGGGVRGSVGRRATPGASCVMQDTELEELYKCLPCRSRSGVVKGRGGGQRPARCAAHATGKGGPGQLLFIRVNGGPGQPLFIRVNGSPGQQDATKGLPAHSCSTVISGINPWYHCHESHLCDHCHESKRFLLRHEVGAACNAAACQPKRGARERTRARSCSRPSRPR